MARARELALPRRVRLCARSGHPGGGSLKNARMLHGNMLKDKNVHTRPLCFAASASWAIRVGGICSARARTPRAYRGESNATRFRHAQAAHWESARQSLTIGDGLPGVVYAPQTKRRRAGVAMPLDQHRRMIGVEAACIADDRNLSFLVAIGSDDAGCEFRCQPGLVVDSIRQAGREKVGNRPSACPQPPPPPPASVRARCFHRQIRTATPGGSAKSRLGESPPRPPTRRKRLAQESEVGRCVDHEHHAVERHHIEQLVDLEHAALVVRQEAAQIHQHRIAVARRRFNTICQVSSWQKKSSTR